MEAVCAEAAQFFKNSKTSHAIKRSDQLFEQLARKMKDVTVAVANSKRAKGYVVKEPRFVPKGYKAISINDVKGALNFAALDRRFCVGDSILKRRDGWAMGGHLSAAATTVVLESDIHDLYTKNWKAIRTNWQFKTMSMSSLIQGILHVDDSIVF